MKEACFLIIFVFFFVGCIQPDTKDPFFVQRQQMVREQIEKRGISDAKVLAAMRKVQRHLFVPAHLRTKAYGDHPLPIGYHQTISQPFIVAFMSSAASLQKNDKVLEIGTGSGYQAAILAEIVKTVYTIEIIGPLAENARHRLQRLGYKNIYVKHGDGYKGWKEYAPFDKIIVTAAPDEVPPQLIKQLKVGGKMILPVGKELPQKLSIIEKRKDGLLRTDVMDVLFVPMVKEAKE